jgi:hypothetical protein
MSDVLPRRVLGTTRLSPDGQQRFGDFLDKAEPGTPLTEGGAWVWETLRASPARQRWQTWALVPNVAGYVREATDHGMFGAGWRRLRRMNPLSCGRLFLRGLLNARGVLRRDFPTLLTLLLELEMANFRRSRPQAVFLHPQITDLLLAMGNAVALVRALDRLRRGFGALPGLATNNLGSLLPWLQTHGLEAACVLAPLHPLGYGMRPSQAVCEDSLRRFEGQVVALAETDLDTDVAAYWRKHRVASGVYDVDEPDPAVWAGVWANWHHDGPQTENGCPRPEEAAAPVA